MHWTGGPPPYSVIISGSDVSIQVHGISSSPLFLDETMGNFTSLVGATATVTDADLTFTDAQEHTVLIRDVGLVTYSEGMRMAAAIYAKRVVEKTEEPS